MNPDSNSDAAGSIESEIIDINSTNSIPSFEYFSKNENYLLSKVLNNSKSITLSKNESRLIITYDKILNINSGPNDLSDSHSNTQFIDSIRVHIGHIDIDDSEIFNNGKIYPNIFISNTCQKYNNIFSKVNMNISKIS